MSTLIEKLAGRKDSSEAKVVPSEEIIHPEVEPTTDPVPTTAVVLKSRKPGGYAITRATMIVKANGTKMVAEDGYYYPKDTEESELCAYFEKTGYLVSIK